MKVLVFFLFVLIKNINCDSGPSIHYHRDIGIPEASRIIAAEEGNKTTDSRIIGGFDVRLGEVPYVAGLNITLTNGHSSVCGASLLSSTSLVTAAHCWVDASQQALEFEVVLGSTRLYSGGTRIRTRRVIKYYYFNPQTPYDDDIAMILIPRITFSDHISPISLPPANLKDTELDYQIGLISGFGRTSDNTQITISQSLKATYVFVYPNKECAKVYSIIKDKHICSARSNAPCWGDSGGPLRVYVANKQTLVGVCSFVSAKGCAVKDPAGYTRVTKFLNFINYYK